ncbi:DUF6233 domain-containing protein [Streptomyces sp. NPDC058471]|uniref:DUF6233 domain-containing protein n=1 Tax=Streptomyces sp. NPDC058471 TaxID=3346516 RepID=UPI00365C22E0
MNEPAPLTRLDLLRFLRRVQAGDLARTDRWIVEEEQREAERIRGEQRRPPTPDWLIEKGIGGRNAVYVHRGGCWSGRKRTEAITRDQARQELTAGTDACPHCRPDTALGLLD